MGLGDFLGDIGDALVPEAVEDVAGGLVHGAQTAAGVVGDVAQGAAWVANPTHWDDIGRGVQDVGAFIANNPGKTWDIAFEVGRHVVKEEILDPQNLAINLGMLAATTLTGGGAGAAWMAKIGSGVRTGVGAMRAARATGEGMTVARGIRAGTTAMRASDAAFTAARAERVAATGLRAAEGATEAASAAGRLGQKVTDVAEFMPRQFARARQAITGNELSYVQRGRQGLAARFEGGAPSMAREMVGDVIRGSSFRPGVAGLGAGGAKLARGTYAVKRGEANVSHVQAVETASDVGEEAYQFQKNPEAYLTKKAGMAGIDVGAIRSAYQLFKNAKKLGEGEENEEPKKKYMPRDTGGFAPTSYDAPVSGYRSGRAQRGPGTSESEYVESDFTVGRLDQFQRGIYDPQSIYEKAGAR